MNEGSIAKRYARALLKFTRDRGSAEDAYRTAKEFEKNYFQYEGIERLLQNPLSSVSDKEGIILSVIGYDPGEDFKRFIRLVVRNRREIYFRMICLVFQKLYRDAVGMIRMEIVTAVPLSGEEQDKIKRLIEDRTDRKIEFVHRVDPSVIGGFVLKLDSRQLDASVSNELKTLRLKMLKS